MNRSFLAVLGAVSLLIIPLVESAAAQQQRWQGYRGGGAAYSQGRGGYGQYGVRGQNYARGAYYGRNVTNSFNGNTLNRNVYVKNNGWGGNNGAAIAAGAVGLIGGLALGAAVAPAYGAYGPAYGVYPGPVQYAVPAPGCYIQNVPGPYGSVQPVRICFTGNGGNYYVQPY